MSVFPEKNKFGEIIPDIFIGQISISESSDFIKNKNNLYSVKRKKSFDKRYSRLNPSQQGSGTQIKINIDLVMKEVVQKNGGTPFWFKRSGKTYANLKIRVIQSMSSTATKDIMSNPEQIFNNGFL